MRPPPRARLSENRASRVVVLHPAGRTCVVVLHQHVPALQVVVTERLGQRQRAESLLPLLHLMMPSLEVERRRERVACQLPCRGQPLTEAHE